MAVLDFPANPNIGDQYDFPPLLYEWDGEKWTTKAGASTDEFVEKTGDTMTGPLTVNVDGTDGHITLGGDPNNPTNQFLTIHREDGTKMARFGTNVSAVGEYIAIQVLDDAGAFLAEPIAYLRDDAVLQLRNPICVSGQGTEPESLTRRDWVENYAPARYAGTLIAQDWNTIILPGFYNVQYGNAPGGAGTVPNAPNQTWTKSPYGVLIVAGDGTFLTQFFLPHADNGDTYPAFRLSYGVTWMPWQYLSKLTAAPADEPSNLEDRVAQLEAAVAALSATKDKKRR